MSSGSIELSADVFELTFVAKCVPLSLSIFAVKSSKPNGEHNAMKATVYCRNCISLQNIFETNDIEVLEKCLKVFTRTIYLIVIYYY